MNENKEGWWIGWVLGGIQTGIACAIMVLLRQVLLYLKNGVWVKISVIDGLLQFTRHHPPDWLIYPGDWIGVHKILSQIPLGVGFILLGLVWAIIVGVVWAIRLGFVGWKLEEYSKLKRTKKAEKREPRRETWDGDNIKGKVVDRPLGAVRLSCVRNEYLPLAGRMNDRKTYPVLSITGGEERRLAGLFGLLCYYFARTI